jgi:hypothetical protein
MAPQALQAQLVSQVPLALEPQAQLALLVLRAPQEQLEPLDQLAQPALEPPEPPVLLEPPAFQEPPAQQAPQVPLALLALQDPRAQPDYLVTAILQLPAQL